LDLFDLFIWLELPPRGYTQQAAQYWITNKVEDRKDGCGETTALGIKSLCAL
jgi:hypothetical protein